MIIKNKTHLLGHFTVTLNQECSKEHGCYLLKEGNLLKTDRWTATHRRIGRCRQTKRWMDIQAESWTDRPITITKCVSQITTVDSGHFANFFITEQQPVTLTMSLGIFTSSNTSLIYEFGKFYS